jgi:seryl-tRNA synthetase
MTFEEAVSKGLSTDDILAEIKKIQDEKAEQEKKDEAIADARTEAVISFLDYLKLIVPFEVDEDVIIESLTKSFVDLENLYKGKSSKNKSRNKDFDSFMNDFLKLYLI